MRRTARLWTISIAAAALLTLPMIAAAQTYPPSSGQATSGQSTASGEQNTPQFHLDQAKRVLDSISTEGLTGSAATEVSTIKTQFDELYKSYKGGSDSAISSATSSSGSSQTGGATGTSGSSATTGSDWKTNFDKIESVLDRLNIPKSSYAPSAGGSTSAMSGTSGSTGTAGAMGSANVNLPSDVRDSLQQFRMHLEQFYSLAKAQQ